MAEIIYILCALTSMLCATMLFRGYFHNRTRLLLWSSLCFMGLAVNNIVLFVDKVVLLQIDLSLLRISTALVAMMLLGFGLVWDSD